EPPPPAGGPRRPTEGFCPTGLGSPVLRTGLPSHFRQGGESRQECRLASKTACLTLPRRTRQREGHHRGAGGDGEVLLAVERVSHRRSDDHAAGLELPERRAGAGIEGDEDLRVAASSEVV